MLPLTIKSEGEIRFFLCQYQRDPFRQEPRNVGVIVDSPEGVAARFWAETSTGGFDRRRLREFADPDNYLNWVHFWKRTTRKDRSSLEKQLIERSRGSYAVIHGGFVGDTADDAPDNIADFLFRLLVERGDLEHALGEDDGLESPKSSSVFANDVAKEFRKAKLLGEKDLYAPIFRNRDVFGKTRPHRFNFVQMNGEVVPMEVFDFTRGNQRLIEHHVGWAKFAFDDVKEAPNNKPTSPYAIVQLPTAKTPDSLKRLSDDSMKVLTSACRIVNWETEWETFKRERLEAAQSGYAGT